MQYMMLINLGPRVRDYQNLSEDERKALADGFQALNETPGVTPGTGLAPPETATTVRVQDGKALTTDGPFVETKEALDGYLMFEAEDLDAAIEAGRQGAGDEHGRRDRDPADPGVVETLERTFRDQWGQVLAALIGFLGDFDLAEEAAQEAFALAAERWPRDGTPVEPRRHG